MTRQALIIFPLLLLSSIIPDAQTSKVNKHDREDREGAFYCVGEWSAGGSYKTSTKRWDGVRFSIDGNNSKLFVKIKRNTYDFPSIYYHSRE